MAINCPKCNAENHDEAKFCDQCGAPLAVAEAGATAAVESDAKPAANWWAITAIVVIIGVLVWLFASPKDQAPQEGGNNSAANPHAAMGDASSASPHGTDAQSGMPDIPGLKAKLDANPLDLETLATLYQTYGMIGRGAQMRPYLDTAVTTIEAQQESLGDKLAETGRGVAIAALLGGDAEGAIIALNKVQELAPGDLETVKLLAEVHFSIDQPAEAIEWYTVYLDSADPQIEGQKYADARANRAMMRISLFEKSGKDEANRSSLEVGIAEFEGIAAENPQEYNAWLQLGRGYGLQDKTTKAEDAYKKCLDLASNEMEKWQAQAGLAILHGEEPPPQPAEQGSGTGSMMGGSPHGGMGASPSDGMGTNPHGGMDSNPHGSTGGGESGEESSGS